jgi:hypothetical protein
MIDLGTALTGADFEALERSWIDRASAEKACLFRVTSIDGAELVGQKVGGNYAGIVFPNIRPGQTEPREYRLRRDSPDVTFEKGKKKELRKYLGPPGRGNLLYFAPGTPLALLESPEVPIVLTEGEKKCLALWRLAWYGVSDAAEGPRFLPVAVTGVWGWKGTIGKEPGPNGERVDVKGVIPDFSHVVWADRKVTIAFDSDVKTNDRVRVARRELARHLIHELGAQVYFLDIPETAASGKIGIDDLLGAVGPDKVLKLLNRAKPRSIEEKRASILEITSGTIELFHTPDKKTYATFTVGDHKETWHTRSREFRNWLQMQAYRLDGRPASTQALEEAIATYEAQAQFDGPELEVGVRLLGHGSNVYLDLADDAWQVVEISASGWRMVSAPPVKFRRSRGMKPLPVPVSGSIEELHRFVNAGSRQNWILIVAWLIAALSPSGPYLILILQGEHGTAKSTLARLLRSLIDPSFAPARSMPRDERDLMIAAGNSRIISFDNLSGIPQWLSDALCRLATGGGFATRELHTDSDEILFDATRPIILNGIDDIAGNADLADRSLIVTLPPIEEENRISEKVFWKDFLAVRPKILGGLLDAVSVALRNLEQVNLPRLPRMADSALWICAAAPALSFSQEEFLAAYSDNRLESVSLSIEASAVAAAIQKLVNVGDWEGTATKLLEALNKDTDEETRKEKHWPKNASVLSSKLRRLFPLLRSTGLDVTFEIKGHARAKLIRIAKKVVQASDRSDRSDALPNESYKLIAVDKSPAQLPCSDRSEESATAPDSRSQEPAK